MNGVTVESPEGLFVRGSIVRGMVADAKSPIMYGWDGAQLPVYFSQDPVLAVSGGGGPSTGSGQGGRGGFGGGAQIPGVGLNVSPNAGSTQKLSPWEQGSGAAAAAPGAGAEPGAAAGRGAGAAAGMGAGAGGGAGQGGPSTGSGQGGRGGFGAIGADAPRVILRFPANASEMLLSGVLVGGENLAGRAQVVDAPIGTGHVVMFAIRPYWRWQTQGTYFLGFNAIMNWNDLNAGK
jgi:hypothetical protein